MTTGSMTTTTTTADQPRGLWVERGAERLLLVRRWFWQMPGAFVTLSVAFGAFLLGLGAVAAAVQAGRLRALEPGEVFWLGLFGVVSAVGFYYTLGGFFNSTIIEVTRGALRLRHGPLPWFGGRRLPAAALRQLYTERTVTTYHDHDMGGSPGKRVSFCLKARLKDGRDLILIWNLPDPDVARAIEAEVEAFLGIEDVPVAPT